MPGIERCGWQLRKLREGIGINFRMFHLTSGGKAHLPAAQAIPICVAI